MTIHVRALAQRSFYCRYIFRLYRDNEILICLSIYSHGVQSFI